MSMEEAIAREHIRDTIARYNIAGDTRNLDAFVDVFTDDAVYEAGIFHYEGKADIRASLKKGWDAKPTGPVARFRRHNVTTTQIDLTGPRTADGRVYYAVFTDLGPDHCGFYVDKYREENSRWLICYRGVWMDWCNPASLFVPEAAKRMLAETGSNGPTPRK